jgi:hypothetical protein
LDSCHKTNFGVTRLSHPKAFPFNFYFQFQFYPPSIESLHAKMYLNRLFRIIPLLINPYT